MICYRMELNAVWVQVRVGSVYRLGGELTVLEQKVNNGFNTKTKASSSPQYCLLGCIRFQERRKYNFSRLAIIER